MNKKYLIPLACLIAGSLFAAAPSFIVPKEKKELSRNQVKEQFGSRLHQLLRVSADLEHAVGLFMMRVATLKKVVVDQGAALLDDEPPFNTASTGRLQKAVDATGRHTQELEKLLNKVDELNNRVRAAVRLEE